MQRPHRPHFVAAEHPWQPSHRVPKPHDRSLAAYVAQLKKIAGHPHPCRKNPPLPGTEASITGRCNLLGSNVREPSPCTISCGSWACWGFPVSALSLILMTTSKAGPRTKMLRVYPILRGLTGRYLRVP